MIYPGVWSYFPSKHAVFLVVVGKKRVGGAQGMRQRSCVCCFLLHITACIVDFNVFAYFFAVGCLFGIDCSHYCMIDRSDYL